MYARTFERWQEHRCNSLSHTHMMDTMKNTWCDIFIPLTLFFGYIDSKRISYRPFFFHKTKKTTVPMLTFSRKNTHQFKPVCVSSANKIKNTRARAAFTEKSKGWCPHREKRRFFKTRKIAQTHVLFFQTPIQNCPPQSKKISWKKKTQKS